MFRVAGDDITAEDKPQGAASANGGAAQVMSVVRALSILSTFSLEDPRLGVSEIAQRLGLHKTTTHRLLRTMELEGFLSRAPDGRYMLGRKIFELGLVAYEQGGTKSTVLHELGRLVESTGETAHLAVLDEDTVLYVEKVESARALRMPSAVGLRQPVHCTALGKALLSDPPDSWRGVLDRRALQAFTPATITDHDEFGRELDEVRQRGYAVDRGEREEGLMCVAAPIRTSAAEICAAVSVAGPNTRMSDVLEEVAGAVMACCAALSERIGDELGRLTRTSQSSLPSASGRRAGD